MRISDWSSDVCSSDLLTEQARAAAAPLYREAYQHPVDLTPNLAEFADSPVGPDAITAGARQIDQTPAALRNPGSEEPFRPNPLWDVTNPNGEQIGRASCRERGCKYV